MLGLCLLAARADALPLLDRMPGLQLYTYRDELARDLPGTLDLIKSLGFREVEANEMYGRTPADFRKLLDERGLTCVSVGTRYSNLLADPDEVAAKAKALGARHVMIAWLPGRQPFTLVHATKTAEEFNRLGKLLREKHGLAFCYHPHGYEFAPNGKDTLFDYLVEKTKAEDVSFVLDPFWVKQAGADPVALLRRHGERMRILHLQDLKPGVATDLSGHTDRDNGVAIGTGQIDFPALLEAARLVGVKHYVIEDESRRVATQIPQGLRYLRSDNQGK